MEDDIDILLEKWYEAKQELALLEKKCDKYKKFAEKIMNDKKRDSLSNGYYTLNRRDMCRDILSKSDVPNEIWNKYSRNIRYPMYTIKKIKL